MYIRSKQIIHHEPFGSSGKKKIEEVNQSGQFIHQVQVTSVMNVKTIRRMILQQVCFKVISCDLNNIIIHTITNSVPPNLYYNPITIVFQVVSFILYRTGYIIYGGNVLSLLTRHIMKCLNVSQGLTEWVQSTWKLEPS